MNIRICEDPACADIEVVVRCRQLDDTVLSLLARLRVYDAKLTGERDGATYVLAAADVLYADTADKKTFLYTADAVYETPLRLYELEEQLGSVEDDDLEFCIYCYNVQPGIEIDYHTGDSTKADTAGTSDTESDSASGSNSDSVSAETTYILNKNTKKFHTPDCSSVKDIKEKNKSEFTGDTQTLIEQGYSPCKNCNP